MNKTEWLFNKERYKRLIKNKRFNIRSFIAVKLELPFALPIPDNGSFQFHYQEQLVCILNQTILDVYKDNIQWYTSVVEVVFFFHSPITAETRDELIDDSVGKSIDIVNLIISLLLVDKLSSLIYQISRQDLPVGIPIRIIQTANFKKDRIISQLIINPYIKPQMEKPKYLNKESAETLAYRLSNYHSNPFFSSIVKLREGHQLLNVGDNNNSIIAIQTGLEMFFSTILHQVLSIHEEYDQDKINRIFQSGFKNWMNDHLGKYFFKYGHKFKFDPKYDQEEENILMNYNSTIYQKRNRIVHQGENFDENHALDAFELSQKILRCITDIINQTDLKTFVYPPEFYDDPYLK